MLNIITFNDDDYFKIFMSLILLMMAKFTLALGKNIALVGIFGLQILKYGSGS